MKNCFYLVLILFCWSSGTSQVFNSDTIEYNGSRENRVNIVYLADGFQQDELDFFISETRKIHNKMFLQAPFKQYRKFFNAFAVRVPSNVSGAAMNPDSLIDNYFGSTFWYQGIERFLVPTRQDRIVSVLANNFPDYDIGVVVVNSGKYGGSGMLVATTSIHSSSPELAFHEIGHSFAHLGDEYWPGSYHALEAPNMTQNNHPATIRWKNWLGSNSIGIYEHDSPGQGWYKPHENCKMEFLGSPFCSVCKEAFIHRIYNLVSPLDAFCPTETQIDDSLQFPLKFKLNLAKAFPNTLKILWILNEDTVSCSADSLILGQNNLQLGSNYLAAIICDTTTMSRKRYDSPHYVYTVNWEIISTVNSEYKLNKTSEFKTRIHPNPATQFICIDFESKNTSEIEIQLIYPNGRIAMTYIPDVSIQKEIMLPVSNLSSGFYIMRIIQDKQIVYTNKIIVN